MDQPKDTTFHQEHFSKTDRREVQGILRTAGLLDHVFLFVSWQSLWMCSEHHPE